MNIYDQLQALEDRYEELGELLSDPDIVSDTTRFMDLSKEEASTRETVAVYREYKKSSSKHRRCRRNAQRCWW